MSKRKVRILVHVDDERKKYGLADGKSPVYMEDLETVLDAIRERLLVPEQTD